MIRYLVLGAAVTAALLATQTAMAGRISFNMAGNLSSENMLSYPVPDAGTFFEGQHMNDYPESDPIPAGSIVDSTGAVVPGVSATGYQFTGGGGINADDNAPPQTMPAYGDGVSQSLFWSTGSMTVTIEGLSADTDYAVGMVVAADGRDPERTMDFTINGARVADDLGEQSMVDQPQFFRGTTDASGDLAIVVDDLPVGAVGWEALIIDTNLSLIPEPATVFLVGVSLLGLVAWRRAWRS